MPGSPFEIIAVIILVNAKFCSRLQHVLKSKKRMECFAKQCQCLPENEQSFAFHVLFDILMIINFEARFRSHFVVYLQSRHELLLLIKAYLYI